MSSSPVTVASGNGHAPAVLSHGRTKDSEIAISVRDLAKSYTIVHEERQDILLVAAANRLKNPLKRPTKETFWALNGVSFDVKRGEVVGIIGRNGAGKSTLLKVLSRITEPTRGEAILHGRLGSLLEVGTGFHPELTGRENVYLNGAVLGMSRAEIDRQFDAIVDFSGTEKFLDTPVKRYSSGMYVRLAFAVAAHLEPEILIVDEVLAVGDLDFQKKCLGKMEDVAKAGRTVLLVSHNMATINSLCQHCIYLQKGKVRMTGPTPSVVSTYLGDLTRDRGAELSDLREPGFGKEIQFTDIRLISAEEGYSRFREPLEIEMTLRSEIDQQGLSLGGSIFNDLGNCIGTLFTRQQFDVSRGQTKMIRLTISDVFLAPGSYYAGFSIGSGGNGAARRDYDIVVGRPAFEVLPMSSGNDFIAEWHPGWGNISFQSVALREVAA